MSHVEIEVGDGKEIATVPTLEDRSRDSTSQTDASEVLTNARLALVGSAAAITWFQGVCLVCSSGFMLPIIQAEMNASEGSVQWVTAAFNITWGCCALVAGRLGDIYGLTKAYIIGMSFYILWLLLSTFMPNLIGLSACRGLAGVGYAIATPAAYGTVGTYFPPGRLKTLAYSAMAGSGAIGAGVGWLLGGLFISASPFTWRALSGVITATSIIPLVLAILFFPKSRPHPTDKKVDWIGAGLITAAQILLGLGLTFPVANSKGWRAPYIPALLVLAVVLFVGFIWRQRFLNRVEATRLAGSHSYPPPLTPVRLFKRSRQLITLYIATMFVYMGTDALAVFGSYFYTDVLRLSGWESGLRVAPNTVSGLSAAILVALLLHKVPARALLIFVDLLGGTSGILFAARPMARAYWKADLWAWVITGAAADGTNSCSSVLISDWTAREDQAVANAVFITFMRFGATLGLAIATLIRDAVQSAHESEIHARLGSTSDAVLGWPDEQPAIWAGVKTAFFFCGAAIYFAALVIAIGLQGWQKVGHMAEQGRAALARHNEEITPSAEEDRRAGGNLESPVMTLSKIATYA